MQYYAIISYPNSKNIHVIRMELQGSSLHDWLRSHYCWEDWSTGWYWWSFFVELKNGGLNSCLALVLRFLGHSWKWIMDNHCICGAQEFHVFGLSLAILPLKVVAIHFFIYRVRTKPTQFWIRWPPVTSAGSGAHRGPWWMIRADVESEKIVAYCIATIKSYRL